MTTCLVRVQPVCKADFHTVVRKNVGESRTAVCTSEGRKNKESCSFHHHHSERSEG